MTDSQLLLESELLAALPETLRGELLNAYSAILRNYKERRWEPSELNGGKLCEVVYTILKGYVSGRFPSRSSKPRNMVDACRRLESEPPSFPRAIRIQIPRMLLALYEIRNNRGVGHVGGDVDPNHMDATCVLEMSKWLVSELIRTFHGVTTEQATAAVESIVEKTIPIIWKVGENYRVLDTSLSMKEKCLLLLYHSRGPVKESDLVSWIEHSNAAVFRRDILKIAHGSRLLEYNQSDKTAEISPLGIEFVEQNLLAS